MRSINLLLLFGIRKNCLRNEMSRSMHVSIRRAIKQIIIIMGAYHFYQLRTKFYPTSAVKVNSICRGNYWGSSMWISKNQVNYWSYIWHSSNTWKKIGIQWSSASAANRTHNPQLHTRPTIWKPQHQIPQAATTV